MTDFLNRTNLQSAYGDKFKESVLKARTMLNKCPPEKFTTAWSKLAEDSFRKNLSDNDAVVVLSLSFSITKEKPTVILYWCDTWELLYENILLFEKYK